MATQRAHRGRYSGQIWAGSTMLFVLSLSMVITLTGCMGTSVGASTPTAIAETSPAPGPAPHSATTEPDATLTATPVRGTATVETGLAYTPTATLFATLPVPTATPTLSPTLAIPTSTPAPLPHGRLLVWSFEPVPAGLHFATEPLYANVMVMNVDGSNPITLTTRGRDAVWSPDGRQVLFAGDEGWGIYVVAADGSSQPHRLPVTGRGMKWSPDGRLIAFECRDSEASNWDICVSKPDGSSLWNLTDTPESDDACPSWSPDSKRLAFCGGMGGADGLYVVNTDGTDRSILTKSSSIVDVKWSPDGGKIAFWDDSGWHVLELGSLAVIDIASKGFVDWGFDWSPDGQRVVVDRRRVSEDHTASNLCVIVLNSLGVEWLTSFPDSEDGANDPVWSPDGRWIAFTSDFELYVLDVEGKSVSQVTHADSTWERYPLWAPR